MECQQLAIKRLNGLERTSGQQLTADCLIINQTLQVIANCTIYITNWHGNCWETKRTSRLIVHALCGICWSCWRCNTSRDVESWVLLPHGKISSRMYAIREKAILSQKLLESDMTICRGVHWLKHFYHLLFTEVVASWEKVVCRGLEWMDFNYYHRIKLVSNPMSMVGVSPFKWGNDMTVYTKSHEYLQGNWKLTSKYFTWLGVIMLRDDMRRGNKGLQKFLTVQGVLIFNNFTLLIQTKRPSYQAADTCDRDMDSESRSHETTIHPLQPLCKTIPLITTYYVHTSSGSIGWFPKTLPSRCGKLWPSQILTWIWSCSDLEMWDICVKRATIKDSGKLREKKGSNKIVSELATAWWMCNANSQTQDRASFRDHLMC